MLQDFLSTGHVMNRTQEVWFLSSVFTHYSFVSPSNVKYMIVILSGMNFWLFSGQLFPGRSPRRTLITTQRRARML
jgi:hypothetical protein